MLQEERKIMSKYYAILDTNVLVSAMLKANSTPSAVVAEALKGDIIPVLNEKIIAEYEDVLNRPKFKFNHDTVKLLLLELKRRCVYSNEGIVDDFVQDHNDVVFYAVLMDTRKEKDAYLVTGNLKHFPVKPYVVTPREMLDIVMAERLDNA